MIRTESTRLLRRVVTITLAVCIAGCVSARKRFEQGTELESEGLRFRHQTVRFVGHEFQ